MTYLNPQDIEKLYGLGLQTHIDFHTGKVFAHLYVPEVDDGREAQDRVLDQYIDLIDSLKELGLKFEDPQLDHHTISGTLVPIDLKIDPPENGMTSSCCKGGQESIWWLKPDGCGPEKEGWSMDFGGCEESNYINIKFCPWCGKDLYPR